MKLTLSRPYAVHGDVEITSPEDTEELWFAVEVIPAPRFMHKVGDHPRVASGARSKPRDDQGRWKPALTTQETVAAVAPIMLVMECDLSAVNDLRGLRPCNAKKSCCGCVDSNAMI